MIHLAKSLCILNPELGLFSDFILFMLLCVVISFNSIICMKLCELLVLGQDSCEIKNLGGTNKV